MGRDKARLMIGEETFLQYLIRRSNEVNCFSEIALLSNGRISHPELKTYDDTISGCGPLGGLLSAMTNSGHSTFATITVDSPTISKRLINVLATYELREETDAAIVQNPESNYPLTGVFRTRLEAKLNSRLLQGNYRVMDFIRSFRNETISCRTDEIWNINTPEDYNQLIRNLPNMDE